VYGVYKIAMASVFFPNYSDSVELDLFLEVSKIDTKLVIKYKLIKYNILYTWLVIIITDNILHNIK